MLLLRNTARVLVGTTPRLRLRPKRWTKEVSQTARLTPCPEKPYPADLFRPRKQADATILDIFQYADTTTIEVNYYTDTIDIGGLTISKQQFGVANVTNATALGIMGLGPNSGYGYNMTAGTYSYILDSLASRKYLVVLRTTSRTA